MLKQEYATYLHSPEWQEIRRDALARDGYRCRGCNTPYHLEVHHRTYAHVGREPLDDLTTLCRTCHAAITKVTRQPKQWSWRMLRALYTGVGGIMLAVVVGVGRLLLNLVVSGIFLVIVLSALMLGLRWLILSL